MAATPTRAKRRAKQTSDDVEETARNGAGGNSHDDDSERGSGGGDRPMTITGELKDTFREAAIEVLGPVMRKATTEAAKYAVKNGPKLLKDKVAPKVADAGGAAGIAKGLTDKGGGIAEAVGGVASKLGGGKGGEKGKSPSGTGRGRRLPVEESIDVGVDLETAYDQFTQFEDWPKFMHRVERIEQRDDTTLMWHENIWGVRRSWEAEIIEQVPCERLVWRSKNGPMSIGIVTFHRLSDQLTRIMFTMDFQPKGLFEKTASGTRISRRALSSDLMRFKAFLELRDEATGGWRGRIEDGEAVDEADDERDDDERDDEEMDARDSERDDDFEDEDEEDEDDEEFEEPEAEEDDDFDDEEADEDEEDSEDEEEERKPRGRRSARFRRDDDEDDDDEAEEDDEEEPKPRRRRRSTSSRTKAKA